MQTIPLVRRSLFAVSIDTLRRLGEAPDRILTQAGIRPWHHGPLEEWVPFEDAMRVMQVAAGASGEPLFGLLAGEQHTFADHGAFGRMVVGPASTYQILATLCRQIRRYNTVARYWLADDEDCIWLCRAQPPRSCDLQWQMELFTVRQLVRSVQLRASARWRPRVVHLCDPRGESIRSSELFSGTRVEVGRPFTAVAVPKHLLSEEAAGAAAVATEANGGDENDLSGSVRRLVQTLLPEGCPSLDLVADIAGVSRRTLQRELAREGFSYRALVGEVRCARALVLLEETDQPLRDIAFELGYAGDEKLVRAFKRWSGVTPGEFRRHRAHATPGRAGLSAVFARGAPFPGSGAEW